MRNVWWAGVLGASVLVGAQLAPAGVAGREDLVDLSFMAGCWEGNFSSSGASGTIEEHYTAPTDNVMLGTTRYIVDGKTTMFEFTKIERDSAGVVLTPYPRGRPSEHGFRLTQSGEEEAVFEAPGHDFPKRIIYKKFGAWLVARIDDGNDESDGKAQEWTMEAAPCF